MKNEEINSDIQEQQSIIKRLDKIYKYTKFVPTQLAEQLNCSVKDLPDKIQQYINSCPGWENKVKKPSNYMIAILKKGNVVYPANICKDIFLQLHVFGRIVGDLYIPKRTLHWSKDVFKQEYYFLEKEVLE